MAHDGQKRTKVRMMLEAREFAADATALMRDVSRREVRQPSALDVHRACCLG